MKLLIDIPDKLYNFVRSKTSAGNSRNLDEYDMYDVSRRIANGKPFDSVLDEIRTDIKAMFPPSGNWMYDEGYEHEHTVCEVLVDVLQIIDKYKGRE